MIGAACVVASVLSGLLMLASYATIPPRPTLLRMAEVASLGASCVGFLCVGASFFA